MEAHRGQDLTDTYIATYAVLLQGIILNKENVCIQRKCVHAYIKSLCDTSFFDAILDAMD